MLKQTTEQQQTDRKKMKNNRFNKNIKCENLPKCPYICIEYYFASAYSKENDSVKLNHTDD